MIAYAARTGTRRNVAALKAAGWRMMISPDTGPHVNGLDYAIDNGAWGAHTAGREWDADRFRALLARMGAGADFAVLPDIVEGGRGSFDRSVGWMVEVLEKTPRVLLAVQDGMDASYVGEVIGPRVGIFVGGSTEFKEQTMAAWGALARSRGAWCHVGRVNSVRRIYLCAAAGVTSFDGSSVSRYAVTLPKLEAARWQRDLFVPGTLMTEDDMEEFR